MKTADIAKKLAGCAENVCRMLMPNGEKIDNEWCVGDIKGSKGNSLRISLSGDSAGAWLDFAGDDSGNLVTLWERVHGLDEDQACREAEEWLGISGPDKRTATHWEKIQKTMRRGTAAELQQLATLRHLSIDALQLATDAGQLYFDQVFDHNREHHAWIVTDSTKRNAQARRMDGQLWEKYQVKAKTLQGSKASWPLGINDSNGHDIALTEGGPDLLAAWHCLHLRGLTSKIFPVAMLGAGNRIPDDALPLFAGKRVHIIKHNDDAGSIASNRWKDQLTASAVQIEDLSGQKDLNDLIIACEGDESEVPAAIARIFSDQGVAIPVAAVEEENWDAQPAQPVLNKMEGLRAIPLTEFKLPLKGDNTILVGNRYISRGDIVILASTSGMGKSSLSLQIATCWALGRDIFGAFLPNGPLKSIFFQSEDSDGDVAEVWFSMMHAMKLTTAEIETVRSRVLIVTDRVHRGLSFRAEAQRQIKLHSPDLVWVNPLLAFIGGDVNDSTDVGLFLREQMNSLNEPPAFAFIFIHHTSKPPKEKKDRQWNEVMYEMAGSADLTNAARAILSLQACEKQGHFKLVLAKRGARAGAKKLVLGTVNPEIKIEQPALEIGLRHSIERMDVEGQNLPVIFWEQAEIEADKPKHPGGRPSKYSIDQFLSLFPKPGEPATTIPVLHRKVSMVSGISLSGLKDLVSRAASDGVLLRHDSSAGFAYSVA